MTLGSKKVYVLAGGGAIVGLLAVGVVALSRHSSPVRTPSVQGAIGQREIYRDSSATATAVDAASTKEFEKLYRIGQFKALTNDPRFKNLTKDPGFAALLSNADFQRLAQSAEFQRLAQSAEFQNLMQSAEFQRIQHE